MDRADEGREIVRAAAGSSAALYQATRRSEWRAGRIDFDGLGSQRDDRARRQRRRDVAWEITLFLVLLRELFDVVAFGRDAPVDAGPVTRRHALRHFKRRPGHRAAAL